MSKREKKVKEKMKKREQARIKTRKDDNKRAKLEYLYREKKIPIMRNPPDRSDKDAEIRARIAHNMKILQGLEEEYQKEISDKKNLNTDLESEGFYRLSDKLLALNKEQGVSGGAEVKFSGNFSEND